MKKYLLALICFFCAYCVKAQTYTGTHAHLTVSLIDSMSHDSVLCNGTYYLWYNVTVDSSFTGDSVNIVSTTSGMLINTHHNTTGASPWHFMVNFENYSTYDRYVARGGYMYFDGLTTKFTCLTDTILSVVAHDSLIVPNPCDWSWMIGFVYIDNDSDCNFTSGDVPIHGIPIGYIEHLSSIADSFTWGYAISSGGGEFNFPVQHSWLNNYVISLPSYYSFIFPPSSCLASTSDTLYVAPDTAYFPLHCSSRIDVECGAVASSRLRLHRDFYLNPFVNNTGCDDASGTMTLVLDSRVNYNATLSIYPADTVRGDTLIWNYSGLSNIATGAYWNSFISNVYLSMDTSVTVGDTLCFRVYTNVMAADVNPVNNDYSACFPVVYSYDPNFKEVSPAGNISASGETLTYTIHFQNTGSDVAENIRVVDTLDSRFDMKTLKILSTSHQMSPRWLASNVVEFDYNYINLPDSSANEPGSHGAVSFSIKLKPGIPFGTQIKNKGYIYFDLNSPVITNATTNTITRPASITNVSASLPVKIYPNPAKEMVYVENLSGGELSIISMNGSVVLSRNIDANKTSIDVSSLADGVYIIKTVNNNATSTIKFTKQ